MTGLNEMVPYGGRHGWNYRGGGSNGDDAAIDVGTGHERRTEVLVEAQMGADPDMVLQSSREMIVVGTRSVSTRDWPQRPACMFSRQSLAHHWWRFSEPSMQMECRRLAEHLHSLRLSSELLESDLLYLWNLWRKLLANFRVD